MLRLASQAPLWETFPSHAPNDGCVSRKWEELILLLLFSGIIHVQLFAASWTAARQASPSITNSQSLLKLMSIEAAMPFNNLVLCHPLLLLPSIFPSIKVFTIDSVPHIRWPKY